MSIVALVNDYCRLVRVGVLLGCEMLRVFLDFLTDCFPLSSQAVARTDVFVREEFLHVT